ncbi:MAG TPA: S41 family peptidase, partial [Spirochaetia bacterium]|nr:S41 family peptidase [Spirochaetia bacterium]
DGAHASAGAVDLDGVSKAELERQASAAGFPYGLPEGGPHWSFSVDRPGIAILSVRTFLFPMGKTDYEKFFDHAFDVMRENRTQALILDLRGNWGGDPDAAAYLFARLIREPAPYFEQGTPLYGPLTRAIPPAPNAFGGELIVLTDGACFSSTGHLCSLLRFHGLATFVGEETGGSWSTTDGAADYVLRCTGMRLRSSNSTFRTAVTGFPVGRGVSPDVEVAPAIADLIAGRDPVMERALSLAGLEETDPAASR